MTTFFIELSHYYSIRFDGHGYESLEPSEAARKFAGAINKAVKSEWRRFKGEIR